MDEVAQAAAAGVDRGMQCRLDDRYQPPETFQRDFPRCRAWVDARAKQAFRRINVADADDAMAIHQHRFDRGLEASQFAL